MNNIPPDKECQYCKKHFNHGGNCYGDRKSYSIPCLGFQLDARGTIKTGSTYLKIEIGCTIPVIAMKCGVNIHYFDNSEIEGNKYLAKVILFKSRRRKKNDNR